MRVYLTEPLDILNQKGPARTLESNSWLHTGLSKNLSESTVQTLQPKQAWCCDHVPEEPVPVPSHPHN